MKTFVVGDIHGSYKTFLEVIDKSGIDKVKDRLICLGDVADGYPDVRQCFDELLTFKNLILILGNHDQWLKYWFENPSNAPNIWLSQGGNASVASYKTNPSPDTERHLKLLKTALPYWVDENNNVFVHGGFNPYIDLAKQTPYELMWDRNLFKSVALYEHSKEKGFQVIAKDFIECTDKYNKIFVGHTALRGKVPLKFRNLWNLDTDAGWDGVLTIMNVDTEEFWVSKRSKYYYRKNRPR